MQAEKISISLSKSLVNFIESYKIAKGCNLPSQVIEVAWELLRNQELESAYRQASSEVDPAWDLNSCRWIDR